MLKLAATCPHSASLIPDLKFKRQHPFRKTILQYEKLAAEIKKVKPDTLIFVSPKGPMRYDKFTINFEENFHGDFESFGIFNKKYSFENDTHLSKELLEHSKRNGLPVELIRERQIDYASLIVLHYLCKKLEKKPKIIILTFTSMDYATHFHYGKIIGEVLDQSERNIVMLSSGDLSQKISEKSNAGFSNYGQKFDNTLMELLKKGNTEQIIQMNPEFCDEAGDCSLRSILMLLGTIAYKRTAYQKLSYESPIGTGHLVSFWKVK